MHHVKISIAGFFSLAVSILNAAPVLLNDPVDVSPDFRALENSYYLADKVSEFDPSTHSGKIIYQRAQYHVRHAFDNDLSLIADVGGNEFPEREYAANPTLPFSIDFISPKTLRIRMTSGPQVHPEQQELMLAGAVPRDDSWKYEKLPIGHRYTSAAGSVTILEKPFHLELRDASGRLLTATDHAADNKSTFSPVLPFGFVRRAADYSRSYNAAFSLAPGEKIFGCGEAFTSFDKRGQKLALWTDDANGIENQGSYKPVPFFMSSRGYGMFTRPRQSPATSAMTLAASIH
jgi:alpha-D-xyloside xylohydrolase